MSVVHNQEEQHVSTDRKEEQENSEAQPPQGSAAANGGAVTGETRRELIAALQQNWHREMEGMRTYRSLAQNERDKALHNVLEKLADAEARHDQQWVRKITHTGAEPPPKRHTTAAHC